MTSSNIEQFFCGSGQVQCRGSNVGSASGKTLRPSPKSGIDLRLIILSVNRFCSSLGAMFHLIKSQSPDDYEICQ